MRFKDESLDQAAQSIVNDARNNVNRAVYFVNAHCINVAATDPVYRMILKSSPFVYADGVGIAIAARIWGSKLNNNVNGTDLFPIICKYAARYGVPIALFGAAPGVVDECATNMIAMNPGLEVAWTRNGYVDEHEHGSVLLSLNSSDAKILLVARGVPLQERWIHDNRSNIKIPVILGVGALFDFYSGRVKRAPEFVRRMKLEWLYRLYLEPRRLFKRYVIGNPEFLVRAVMMKITGND